MDDATSRFEFLTKQRELVAHLESTLEDLVVEAATMPTVGRAARQWKAKTKEITDTRTRLNEARSVLAWMEETLPSKPVVLRRKRQAKPKTSEQEALIRRSKFRIIDGGRS